MNNDTKVCVFVGSSAKSGAILHYTYPNIKQFAKRLVVDLVLGTNSEAVCAGFHFNQIFKSDDLGSWGNELALQLTMCKKYYTHILFILDDMWIDDLNVNEIAKLIHNDELAEVDHLLLRPHDEALIKNFVRNLSVRFLKVNKRKISGKNPYCKSLKPAVWLISHFLECLLNEADIWRFETTPHKIVSMEVTSSLFAEYHLVEKGLLRTDVMNLLNIKVDTNNQMDENKKSKYNYLMRRVKFKLFGYVSFRLKNVTKDLIN